jgi:hypothetical protein
MPADLLWCRDENFSVYRAFAEGCHMRDRTRLACRCLRVGRRGQRRQRRTDSGRGRVIQRHERCAAVGDSARRLLEPAAPQPAAG